VESLDEQRALGLIRLAMAKVGLDGQPNRTEPGVDERCVRTEREAGGDAAVGSTMEGDYGKSNRSRGIGVHEYTCPQDAKTPASSDPLGCVSAASRAVQQPCDAPPMAMRP
jgi:hypothetical protein